ncbi:MAG TPA: M20/M25/M40 family metallo-hydrolase [Candidatus Polarisedimenticolaceae bacterium]|nr:M20/M25/M40 family metallo-hydrolase [Candidatus Polarisedimenticolaceae bacterium]
MSLRPSFAASILAALAVGNPLAAADGPDAAGARLVGAALVQSRAHDKLAYLTDRIGHRLSGSAALERAVQWAADEFRRDGMDRVWTEKVLVPHWVRGPIAVRVVSPIETGLVALALGGSVSTPAAGIQAELIEFSSLDELKAAGEAVRGKIVLFNKPIAAGFDEEHGYGSAVGLRVDGASAAARQGAVAMLLRSLGTADFRLPHTGAMRYATDAPKIPAAAVAAEDALMLHRLLAAGERVRVQLALEASELPDAESANVLAELRGRERPAEVVLLAAHLDSWDVGQGAIDDGAGCAIVMETMRLLQQQGAAPRRTIRAVLYTNEENGTRGGKAYVEAHRGELALHVAAIESDSGGAAPQGFGVSAGPGGAEAVREIARELAGLGAGDVVPRGGGADIGPLKEFGVPLLSLRQDSTHYFDYHHTPADTLDKVRPAELDLNVAALAWLAWMLAEREAPLPRLVPEPAR